jgi:ABC-type amino acid transport substrate-binding protein
MTVSMLKGEHGHQRKELDKLIAWLREHYPNPDVINLPFTLLIGLAAPLRQALGGKIVCTLQGEDLFLDQLEEPWRGEALALIREQAKEVDLFVAVSEYYARTMPGYLGIPPERIRTVPLGINFKDFDYLTVAVQAPNVLTVPVNSPHKSLADVLAFHKANPGKMSFASAGNGTSDHLTAELFWQQTGTTGLHIPYKGGAPAMSDLLGGQVDATFMNINTGYTQIKAGKLRALAITSAKRSPLLPDVPTMEESGLKGVTVYSWQAFAAPKGLPADIKAKLHDALVAGLNDPAVKPKLLELGFEIVGNTPEQFTAFQAAEFARWKKVIEVGKITAD